MRAAFYAHSLAGLPPDKWEPLEDHLRLVADLAGEFASELVAGHSTGSHIHICAFSETAGIHRLIWRVRR